MISKQPSPRKMPREEPEKDVLSRADFIYPLDGEDNEIKMFYNGVVKPLQLFAPFAHEDEAPQEPPVLLERPITPIGDEIKSAPQQLHRLARYVRRRLSPQADVKHLAEEDQKELAAIIMGEVNDVWTDIRQQVDHPFFNATENAELQRRIAVHVVTVCEHLYQHYINKAHTLQKRGVFSAPANMSRLKAQLALDTHKYLNILTIRRYIVEDLQQPASEEDDDDDIAYLPMESPDLPDSKASKSLSNKNFLEASRPKSKTQKQYYVPYQQAVNQMRARMPGLDTNKLVSILTDMTIEPPAPVDALITKAPSDCKRSMQTNLEISPPTVMRPGTAPGLLPRDDLLEELGIEQKEVDILRLNKHKRTSMPNVLSITTPAQPISSSSNVPLTGRAHLELVSEDLARLVVPALRADAEDDMPPLLQAISRSPKNDSDVIDRRLAELEEREAQYLAAECIHISDPRYPQPDTVVAKLPNQVGVAKTSDVRVSERLCMWSMTLEKHGTVYNDLLDEIDAATVKQLDSNLFLGDAITEVYKEIMNTVPTDHLDLENDPLVEDAATEGGNLSLSQALASATLSRPFRKERIINPHLACTNLATPWGEQAQDDWARTPSNPTVDKRGRPLVQPMTPRGEDKHLKDFFGKEAHKYVDDSKNMSHLRRMGEVMAHSYASWLKWWKKTINSDDYMKYLSNQATDYMGVIFHFYDSEAEDDDDDAEGTGSKVSKKKLKQIEERAQQRKQLSITKNEFQHGVWNANAVLMGGLGTEPDLEDEVASASQLGRSEVQSEPNGKRRGRVGKRSKESQSGASNACSMPTASKGTIGEHDVNYQERLEQVWLQLQMPSTHKLSMAVKYSSEQYHKLLHMAIRWWERARNLILEREQQLARLEEFERIASDPNRFFEKGSRGSSVARLEEARFRGSIYKKMAKIELQLSDVLKFIEKEYGDVVTFQGRVYASKMVVDRTEMLYWLQEERKQRAIEYELSLELSHNQRERTAHTATLTLDTTGF